MNKEMMNFLRCEILNKYNLDNLIWCHKTFNQESRLLHRKEWEDYIINNNENITFFTWLPI